VIEKQNNKGVFMDLIKLESVGTAVTSEGTTHPINTDGTLDMYDGMAGNIFESDDEWYWSLSLVDGYNLFNFLEEHLGYDVDNPSAIYYSYTEWKEKVKGLMGRPDTLVEVS
tara:strand:- start:1555 stop:1890 length:336 start_codon:yes stop_codon:yes gene_type:complete